MRTFIVSFLFVFQEMHKLKLGVSQSIERIKEDSDSCEEDALASYDLIDMQKEEEDVDDSANEERQYAECLEIDLLKNKADEMDEEIVVDFLQNDDGFEFDDVDVDADV